MPLAAGTRIAQYEIGDLAGSGGMGEVYRARDTQLKRDAALKVLPAILARDPDRIGRFQREAEILASLNHSGIATIYGFVQAGDLQAIAMEFVEGPTLAETLQKGALTATAATGYAREIINALEYAHERGVMHRDLKPANIKVTAEGSLKLLDFGLAKAIEDPSPSHDPSQSPTLTLGHTQAGAILGTGDSGGDLWHDVPTRACTGKSSVICRHQVAAYLIKPNVVEREGMGPGLQRNRR